MGAWFLQARGSTAPPMTTTPLATERGGASSAWLISRSVGAHPGDERERLRRGYDIQFVGTLPVMYPACRTRCCPPHLPQPGGGHYLA